MTSNRTVDILLITCRRPEYTRRSIARLLDTCDAHTRVWLWHNGDHAETLAVTSGFARDPRVHRFHHSPENRVLREPTNWLLGEADGAYLAKVDDDCLVPAGWLDTLRSAHEDEPRFGVLGCWRFQSEDFDADLAAPKIQSFDGGHRILRNCWVEGSGFLMKRGCVEHAGLLRDGESFTGYCIRIAAAGWINGWYYPFLPQEHMDDPRAPHSLLRTDDDLATHLPLSAKQRGVTNLEQWVGQLRASARTVQVAPVDPRTYVGARKKLRRLITRLRGEELRY
ncbi:MAG: glycosyltransferase [Planctomycetes bacterium]|nr:glycosyltransferase [Planctomycetota bacterium]